MLQHPEYRAGAPTATGAACNGTFQFAGNAPQLLLPGPNLAQMMPRQGIHVFAGQFRILGQAQQASDLVQTEAEIPSARDEPDSLHVLACVGPISTGSARWAR